MQDFQTQISSIEDAAILQVYVNLSKASRNHLRRYYSAIEALGIAYEPICLEEDEFFEIVNSEMEKGRG